MSSWLFCLADLELTQITLLPRLRQRKDSLVITDPSNTLSFSFWVGGGEQVCGEDWADSEAWLYHHCSKTSFHQYLDLQKTLNLSLNWEKGGLGQHYSGFVPSGAPSEHNSPVFLLVSWQGQAWGTPRILLQLTLSTHQCFLFLNHKNVWICKWILTFPFISLQWSAKWRTRRYPESRSHHLSRSRYRLSARHKLPCAYDKNGHTMFSLSLL